MGTYVRTYVQMYTNSSTVAMLSQLKISRVSVPPTFLQSILVNMHPRLQYPTSSKLQSVLENAVHLQMFKRCVRVQWPALSYVTACVSFPKYQTNSLPKTALGIPAECSHMYCDVIEGAIQLILFNTDILIGYSAKCLIDSEQRDDLADGILY